MNTKKKFQKWPRFEKADRVDALWAHSKEGPKYHEWIIGFIAWGFGCGIALGILVLITKLIIVLISWT